MTLEQIKNKWQKQLHLDYWKINISFLNPQRIQGNIGMATCNPDKEEATIWINNNYQNLSGYNKEWTLEQVIIHELMHILLWNDISALPQEMQDNSEFVNFYEYICDLIPQLLTE